MPINKSRIDEQLFSQHAVYACMIQAALYGKRVKRMISNAGTKLYPRASDPDSLTWSGICSGWGFTVVVDRTGLGVSSRDWFPVSLW